MSDVTRWLEKFLLPEVKEIQGELKALNTKVDEMDRRLDSKIDEMDRRLTSEIHGVRIEVQSTKEQLKTGIEAVRNQFNAIERIVRLEEKIKELESKKLT